MEVGTSFVTVLEPSRLSKLPDAVPTCTLFSYATVDSGQYEHDIFIKEHSEQETYFALSHEYLKLAVRDAQYI